MINRKTFLTHTTLAAAGMLFDGYAQPLYAAPAASASSTTPAHGSATEPAASPAPAANGFQLKIMATDWGFPGTLDEYGAKVRAAGYDGIEIWWSLDPERQKAIFEMLAKYQLEVGFLCAGSQSDPKEHFATFKAMVEGAARNTRQRPLYINCHSGRDYFTYDENKPFIDLTTALTKETGI